MSGRKWVLVASVFVVGLILGTLLSQFYISNPTEYRVGVWLRVYIDNVLVLEKRSDSPVANFGNLSKAWFTMEYRGSTNDPQNINIKVKSFANTNVAQFLIQFYGRNDVSGYYTKYFFFALDDATPPQYDPNMVKPYDADSVIDYISDADSGFYIDTNNQIVLYITSENFAPPQNRSYTALGLGFMVNYQNGFTDGNLVLLFYDPLSTPLNVQAGQAIRIEYRFVYP